MHRALNSQKKNEAAQQTITDNKPIVESED